ncbi:MAG TPA: fatty acid desaturase [Thiobacillaceae bacterium]|nr:fatty acid desaturase [Thiobacillaceae bacterium]
MHLSLLTLPWWAYLVVTLGLTHITIASVTIFLHRSQAHRALDLHPLISHFFRFWLWLTTGMVTKEWVAIHRKHHAKCETPEDPHSPQVLGIKKVLFEGAELYRAESKNQGTLDKYGRGTPDDWLERNIYTPHSGAGIVLMMAINLVLFGPIGLTIWAVQMAWIPVTAAGIINGIGHYWGYRNFAAQDASTNIVPWGIIIGGEELHNNHHAYGTSAKLSAKWYEFDIGWMYIRIMAMLGLAKVLRVAPKVSWQSVRPNVDLGMLQAVITHRYDVVTRYASSMKQVLADEVRRLKSNAHIPQVDLGRLRQWLRLEPAAMQTQDRDALDKMLAKSDKLNTIYRMRIELSAVWERSNASKEQLVKQLQDWCQKAEASGIEALQEFSHRLRRYA